MKKISIYLLLLLGSILIGCNNNTYSNALKEEEKLIENFIKRQGRQVVTEEPTEWNENVYWKIADYDNFYFHLVEKGNPNDSLEAKDWVNLRYIQYTLEAYADTTRFWNTDDYGANTPKVQYMVSSEKSCAGWQIALQHMKYSGAQCKIICPSTLGFTDDNSNVIPYGYDMKIQITPN